MMLCPIAVVAGCRKCPAVSICPLKGVIGDFKADADVQSPSQSKQSGQRPRSDPRGARKG